jgi:hypothetical protein
LGASGSSAARVGEVEARERRPAAMGGSHFRERQREGRLLIGVSFPFRKSSITEGELRSQAAAGKSSRPEDKAWMLIDRRLVARGWCQPGELTDALAA